MALALAGEAGELANLVKKEWRGDIAHCDRKEWERKVKSEICDVAGYAFMAACVQGFDLIEETYKKLLEVEQRPEFKRLVAAAKVRKMLGPLPPSELAKMQEKGEEDKLRRWQAAEARNSGVAVNDENWDKLANLAARVPMVAISKAELDELKDKAWRYDECSK